jgi:hypothetical protein
VDGREFRARSGLVHHHQRRHSIKTKLLREADNDGPELRLVLRFQH